MLYHFELQMAGVLLFTVMMVCGVSLWFKRRRQQRQEEEITRAASFAGITYDVQQQQQQEPAGQPYSTVAHADTTPPDNTHIQDPDDDDSKA